MTGASLMILAACAGTRVTHSQAPGAFGEGNVLTNGVGEQLSFLSINKEPLGNILAVSAAGDYMCYDDQIDPCGASVIPDGFKSAGATVVNCGSPIFFASSTGSISGSVQNLTQDHSASCGH